MNQDHFSIPFHWIVMQPLSQTFLLFLLPFLVATPLAAADLPVMRISVENTERHLHSQAVGRYAAILQERLRGQIDVQFYPNAQLFRDKDVVQALAQGKIEMAVPGSWHLAAHEANVGIFLLPAFYGCPAETNYAVLDGEIGRALDARIAEKLPVTVLGRWIDLGHAHLFSLGRTISRHEDIAGLKIRVAGGLGNELRIRALGGVPVSIAWPDLSEQMGQQQIDAILTSYETVHSAGLERRGITSVFEDKEYFPQYIPLVRSSFWEKLPPPTQAILRQSWEEQVDQARIEAAAAQQAARTALIDAGLKVVVPDPETLTSWRERLRGEQENFIQAMDIDPALTTGLTARTANTCQDN